MRRSRFEDRSQLNLPDAHVPRVIYILGWGRSGSTLLGNTLGELQGCVSVGELHDFWSAYASQCECGCGQSLPDCPFWDRVAKADPAVARALESAYEVHRRKLRYLRVRYVPRMLLDPPPGATFRASIDAHAQLTYRLYRSLAAAADATIVVDSGKTPAAAALLLRMPLRASFIHLVRDPRATGYSWQRHRAANRQGTRQQVRLGYGHNATSWLIWNAAAELIRWQVNSCNWLRVRYEDFAASPEAVLNQIVEGFELPTTGWPLQDRIVRLGTHHTVEGNPSRFRTGLVAIKNDDEWSKRMSAAERAVSVGITAPLFIAYGYHRFVTRGS